MKPFWRVFLLLILTMSAGTAFSQGNFFLLCRGPLIHATGTGGNTSVVFLQRTPRVQEAAEYRFSLGNAHGLTGPYRPPNLPRFIGSLNPLPICVLPSLHSRLVPEIRSASSNSWHITRTTQVILIFASTTDT